ncbi:MAG: hypothetical protein A3F16_03825 [Deltaproteobacteria bacterium RIFCSPHIGHO2_12_FULL_43_9]|nr:MAG: hypothetical protein A3F16_03825 [Deltaproteobacteria bacterium RIFCSPHIGHO2_12_FULL_43_9]
MFFAPTAAKQLAKFSPEIRTRLLNAISKLSTSPFLGKRLKGDLGDYYSYRVGNYRVVYLVRQREIQVEIVRVAHRKEVYK